MRRKVQAPIKSPSLECGKGKEKRAAIFREKEWKVKMMPGMVSEERSAVGSKAVSCRCQTAQMSCR